MERVAPTRKPIIGICGGIGSGKSLVAKEFQRLGGLVVDSDKLNHEILARPDVSRRLREWWGESVLTADGMPNRKRIGEIVFADPAEKRRLESLTYPLIARERADMILAGNEDVAVKAIILDSPLLFESRLDRLCDTIVYVEASETDRLARLQQSRGWDLAELRRRERWQLPLAEKRARSEHVIDNDATAERLRSRVAAVMDTILKSFSPAR